MLLHQLLKIIKETLSTRNRWWSIQFPKIIEDIHFFVYVVVVVVIARVLLWLVKKYCLFMQTNKYIYHLWNWRRRSYADPIWSKRCGFVPIIKGGKNNWMGNDLPASFVGSAGLTRILNTCVCYQLKRIINMKEEKAKRTLFKALKGKVVLRRVWPQRKGCGCIKLNFNRTINDELD